MAKNARATSLNYSWQIYHENVAKAVVECIKNKKG